MLISSLDEFTGYCQVSGFPNMYSSYLFYVLNVNLTTSSSVI